MAEPFSTPSYQVEAVLKDIEQGLLGLPDFQRNWKWGADRIFELLCSILRDYPAGSLLFLEAATGELNPRSFHGSRKLQDAAQLTLVLDGQQRLTSLWLALRGARDPNGRPSEAHQQREALFLVDVGRLLKGDDETDLAPERFLTYAIPQFRGRKIPKFAHYLLRDWDGTGDEDSGEFKWTQWDGKNGGERLLMPLYRFLGKAALLEIDQWHRTHCGTELGEQRASFLGEVQAKFDHYKFPVVILHRGYGLEKVCFIFEKVNAAGLPLSTFEFLTARLYRPEDAGKPDTGFNLRTRWNEELASREGGRLRHMGVSDLVVLQTLTLIKTFAEWENAGRPEKPGPSCRRADIFKLTTDEVMTLWDGALDAIDACLELLTREGVLHAKWFAYPTVLPAMAAIWYRYRSRLDHDQIGPRLVTPLVRWYWCSVFSRRYSGLVETKLGEDTKTLVRWVESGDTPPAWIQNMRFNTAELYDVSRQSNVWYRGAICLLIKKGMLDFHLHEPISTERLAKGDVDDHHVFPKAYMVPRLVEAGMGKDAAEGRANCVLNRTLIDATTNKIISDNAPSIYLQGLLDGLPTDDARQKRLHVMESHAIPVDEGLRLLRANDFDAFLRFREAVLADLIRDATGGTVESRPAVGTDEDAEEFGDEQAIEGAAGN